MGDDLGGAAPRVAECAGRGPASARGRAAGPCPSRRGSGARSGPRGGPRDRSGGGGNFGAGRGRVGGGARPCRGGAGPPGAGASLATPADWAAPLTLQNNLAHPGRAGRLTSWVAVAIVPKGWAWRNRAHAPNKERYTGYKGAYCGRAMHTP